MFALATCALIGLTPLAPWKSGASLKWALTAYPTLRLRPSESLESQERWLEVIEVYTLPFDPMWTTTVAGANTENMRVYFPTEADKLAYRKATPEERVRRNKELLKDLQATSEKPPPLKVMRAWDGIMKTEVVFTFGKGQRAIVDRFKPGKPLQTLIGFAAPGDDFQATRSTVRSITASSKPPSDFAAASDAPSFLHDIAFGEIDLSTQSAPAAISVLKDPAPGSGVLSLAYELPQRATVIDLRYPWYVEFRLFELDKDGKRVREVAFTGVNSLVSIPKRESGELHLDGSRDAIANGRIKVKSPQPWGYEAEIVRWFGVAPKSMLKPSSKPGKAIGGDESSGSEASPPSAAEDDPLAVPTTPEIPDDS